jgi:hypothetical protein
MYKNGLKHLIMENSKNMLIHLNYIMEMIYWMNENICIKFFGILVGDLFFKTIKKFKGKQIS